MKKITILLLVLLTNCLAYAQSETETQEPQRKNAIKINILPPILSSTGEISYERLVKPNLSFVLGVGGNFRADQSDFQLNSDSDLEFLDRDIRNRYILAEARRYINFCDGGCAAPHGFYAGGFMRYNSLSYSAHPHFDNGNTNLDFNINLDLRSLNFGALLGYQIKYKKLLVDFEFGGIGYAPNWISFNSDATLSNDALAKLSDVLNENFDIGGGFSGIDLNSTSFDTSFWALTFRYAVSVGYHF